MGRIALLSLLMLGGCTTARTTMLGPTTASVAADDLSTGSQRAVDRKALATAARAASVHGYAYFTVVGARADQVANPNVVRGRIGSGDIDFHAAGNSSPSRNLIVRFLAPADLPAVKTPVYAVRDVL